jgi:hypothetical protein
MIIAKTVVPKRYWILKDQRGKIGNIESHDHGYNVRVKDSTATFKTLDMVRERMGVEFDETLAAAAAPEQQIYGFPTNCVPHNAMWDLKRRLPLYTASARSKSWLAAGYYKIKYNNSWRNSFCPKVILLDRYEFQGPFSDPTTR